MNRELLLQHFNRISEAPDAIVRLRRFILDLAVRGKLVEQDPGDEPAGELLKRITAEKERLGFTQRRKDAKKGKNGGDACCDVAALRELTFNLPVGWEWTRIRQITSDRGQTIPDKTFTYIDVTAINKEAGCIGDAQVVEPADAPSRARKKVFTGDVLYSCVRPYLLNIAVVEKDIIPAPIASTAFAVLNGFGLVLARYQWIVLRSPFMVECVENKMRGQAYPAINDSDFAVLPFPLPPLAEQHRIVAKVDELMALCDQLEAERNQRETHRDKLVAASLNRISTTPAEEAKDTARFHLSLLPRLTTKPEHIKQLRQTILNLAVRGRLVEQDPNDEPASTLICKILKKGKCSLLKSEPFPLSESWLWVKLGDISEIERGGSPRPIKDYLTDNPDGINWIKISDTDMGGKYISTTKEKIRKEGLKKTRMVYPGDFLLTNSMSFGRPYITRIEGCIHDGWLRIHPPEILDKDYLYNLLSSPYVGSFFKGAASGAVVSNLNSDKVRDLPIPLPPLAEQQRIVAKVDELMRLCDQLEAQLTTTTADSRRLLEAVLHDALKEAV